MQDINFIILLILISYNQLNVINNVPEGCLSRTLTKLSHKAVGAKTN